MMKKIINVIMCFFFLQANMYFVGANLNDEEIIKIGYFENYGLMESENNGYAYDYFNELSLYTNHSYEFIKCDLDKGIEMLEDGEIDLLGPIIKTIETSNEYGFTKNNFGYEELLIIANKDDEVYFNDFQAINNSKIDVIKGSPFISYIDDYLLKNEISAEYIYYDNYDEVHDYDYRVSTNTLLTEKQQIVAKIGSMPIYFVTQNDNKKLVEELDMALVQIAENNRFFENELYTKYFSTDNIAPPALTQEDIDLLEKKDNRFTVLIDNNHEPVQYIDNDGKPHGIAIDILDMIAASGGIVFDYIYETKDNDIDYENIDIAVTLQNTVFTNKEYTKTDAYLESPMMMVGKKDNKENHLKTVGMLDYRDVIVDANEVITFENYDEMIELILKGEIDCIVSSDLSSTYILENLGAEQYMAYPISNNLTSKMLVSNELSEYVEIFNKLIARLDQKIVDAIIIGHISHFSPEYTVVDLISNKPSILFSAISTITLVILFLIIMINKSKKSALQKIINKDHLTNLDSPYRFYNKAKDLLKTAKPNEYLLVSIDVDNFQYLNEAYGYKIGNTVLIELANSLVEKYGESTLITRINADNFLILTKNVSNIQVPCGKKVCDDCIFNSIKNVLGVSCKVSMSRGVYEIYDSTEELSYMIDCANRARLLGKQIYRTTNYQFTEQMRQNNITTNKIVNSMEFALKNREFEVFYQPKVDLIEYKLSGAEALVRWNSSNGNMIFPDSFIPIFEKNRFIVELDFYVFEEVCSFIAKWKDTIEVPIISVNLSVITVLNKDLITNLLKIVSKYKLQTNMLELEITEGSVVKNYDDAVLIVKLLKDAGFFIALDDFGSGLSSLNRLKELDFDVLKIDKDFLSKNMDCEKGLVIIDSVINLSKKLSMDCIAEGVETKEHVDFLRNLGCEYAQGYYFGKPMNMESFKEVIINGIDVKD